MENYEFGGLLVLIGVGLAIFFKQPHFYAFFSVGLFVIFLQLYHTIIHRKLFVHWKFWHYVAFWGLLLAASLIIDHVGMKLGYWYYPYHSSPTGIVVRYVFEWCIALMYVTLSFFIGLAIFKKHHVRPFLATILSLVIVVIPIGLITEFLNHLANSWVVTGMPFTGASFDGYFLVFQTIGYWIMALIPWLIYDAVDAVRVHRRTMVH